MAKNKKNKVQEVEHILVIPNEVLSEELKAKEVDNTDARNKAQELLQVAVNEVIEGVMPLGDILRVALRKVRLTSVLSEEVEQELNKLHIEVEVKY